MRHIFMAAAAATAIATVPTLAPAQSEGDCGEVTITEMSWASASVVTAVATFLMDQGYGCDVTKVPSSITPALASVAETGEPDILTELWVNSAPVYDRLVEEGKLEPLTRVLSDGSVQGWYVPDYLLEEHPELGTIEGVLENPDLLDNRFHNCPEGWDCRTVNDNILAAAGFEEAGLRSSIMARARRWRRPSPRPTPTRRRGSAITGRRRRSSDATR